MRCIEIGATALATATAIGININMRCIEISIIQFNLSATAKD